MGGGGEGGEERKGCQGGGEGGEERQGCQGGGEGEGASPHSSTGLWLAMTPAASMRVVTVHSFLCIVYSVHCIVDSGHSTLYSVQ